MESFELVEVGLVLPYITHNTNLNFLYLNNESDYLKCIHIIQMTNVKYFKNIYEK